MTIGVCGFSSTGSSAVSDFLKEYDEVESLDNFEFTMAFTPDGLEDLDHHLNVAISKFDSSSVAIPRFRKMILYRYLRLTNGKIGQVLQEYLESLCQVSWIGHGSADFVLFNSWLYKNWAVRFCKSYLFPWLFILGIEPRFFPARKMEFSAHPDDFVQKTQKFVSDTLALCRKHQGKKLVLDQPFAGNDPVKSFKYFENPKAIVIDRDPRDNYLFTIKVLKSKGRQIPTDTVQNFVAYYKHMRDNMPYKKAHPNVLVLHFEEMIYDYDRTKKRIESFLGLGEHSRPLSVFDPKLSINNTQLFRRYPEYKEDIAYIEKELGEYLFHFEDYPEQDLTFGKMFYGKSPLNRSK